jgi:hypothetical protein
MIDPLAKAISKNRPMLRHPDSTSKFLDKRSVRSEVLASRAASTGFLRECRFLDNDLRFLDSHLNDLRFGIEIRASRGAIP